MPKKKKTAMSFEDAKSILSPEEYAKTLGALELDSIHLIELSVKRNQEFKSGKHTISITKNIEKSTFRKAKNNHYSLCYGYDIKALAEGEDQPVFTFSCIFEMLMQSDIELPEAFKVIYSHTSAEYQLWPFVRELVSNTVARLGLPTLTLPIQKPEL